MYIILIAIVAAIAIAAFLIIKNKKDDDEEIVIVTEPDPIEPSDPGRIIVVDDRDKDYPLPKPDVPEEVTSKFWEPNQILNQGNTPHCVVYAGDTYLAADPIINKLSISKEELYAECQKVDEWPGENYDGTSVRALFKTFKAMGYVSEYRWAYDVETVVAHLLTVGPVVVGTDWYERMFYPDTDGYIWPDGNYVGGHAYILIGADKEKQNPDGTIGAVRMLNSYGSLWGENGEAWISFDVLAQLISEEVFGEACAAKEIVK